MMENNQESNMAKAFKGYVRGLSYLSGFILAVSWGLFATVFKSPFPVVFLFVVLYFYIMNAVQHFSLLKSSGNNQRVFQTNYFMWFGIKLLLHLTFILIYVLVDKANALVFVSFFGACYIFYTVYEVSSLSKILRKTNVK